MDFLAAAPGNGGSPLVLIGIGVVIGIFVGWHVPQPKWAKFGRGK